MKRSLSSAWALTALCIVLALLSVSMTGCQTLANLNVVNPRYSLRDVRPRVQLAIPPSIDFDLVVGVDNPNKVALRLDRFDFDLFVNDNHILNSVSTERVNIPAQGIGDVRLRARLDYNNARAVFRELADMVTGSRPRYELRGNAYYDTPVGQLRFPVNVYSSSSRDRL